MELFIKIMMFLLWGATAIAVVCTAATGFQYPDLNLIVIILLAFSVLNGFFLKKP